MFLRTHPSSPLSTISYTNTTTTTLHTPVNAQAADPPSLKTPLKPMQQTPARGGSAVGGGAAFPPELGSSSPPMSSPTSYRDLQPSLYSDSSSTRTQRGQLSSAGMFAARARALQPPLQRSSSLVQGSGSSSISSTMDSQHFRYGRRPGIRKSMTGSGYGYGGDSSSQTSNSTGYSLFYKPSQSSSQEAPAARSTTAQRHGFIPSMQPPPSAGTEQSIQGTMWKGRFRQRCLASSRRREGSDAMRMGDGEDDQQDNEAEEAEHEEIFRRMIQKEQRKQAHRIAVSFEQEVGGSDPAVWEAEVREAEELADSGPLQVGIGGSDGSGNGSGRGNTPHKRPTVDAQWQYRSATKPLLHHQHHLHQHGQDVEEEEGTEEADQYAAFLQAQAEEDRLLAEYADHVAPPTHMYDHDQITLQQQRPQHHQLSDLGGDTGTASSVKGMEQPLVDTPGAELGIEMQGFTWEDAPLSDDEGMENEADVEMA